jgi:hypothetical protein
MRKEGRDLDMAELSFMDDDDDNDVCGAAVVDVLVVEE